MTSRLYRFFILFFAVAFALPAVAGQQLASSRPASETPPSPASALQEALRQQRASLEIQKQSIHSQLGKRDQTALTPPAVEQFIVPLLASNQADCPLLDSGRLDQLVLTAARKQSLDPALIRSVIRQESGFKPCAVSVKGAQGLMQLMPATARELHVSDPFDPSQNIHAGAAYLKQMLTRYRGDLQLALAAYNAGPNRADLGMETPLPVETQNYVAGILADLGLDRPEEFYAKEDLAPPDDADEPSPPPKP